MNVAYITDMSTQTRCTELSYGSWITSLSLYYIVVIISLQVSLGKLLGDERAIGLLSVVLLFNTSGISPGRMKNSWHCDQVQERTWDTLLKYFTTKISNTAVVVKRMDDAVRVVNLCQDIRTDM